MAKPMEISDYSILHISSTNLFFANSFQLREGLCVEL